MEISLPALHLGKLVAEGGEGRVFEVEPSSLAGPALDAGAVATGGRLVYKQLHQPRPLREVACIVEVPSVLAAGDEGLAARARSSAAWPTAAVVGDDREVAVGTLMPRAPESFWLRHRDGRSRLATLSYLAGDPDRIALAYGAHVPAPGAPERVAVVYALCRLLEAWQASSGRAGVVHGDLSARNVLWSLVPSPCVFVLDCDGAIVGAGGTAGEGPQCRQLRATTPNWDDPALPAGSMPTEASDRYSLGLVFLRVVGAAHFPLQVRQRSGGKVSVDLELPRSWRRLPDMPRLWELCERSLSVARAGDRPGPGEWARTLEELLDALTASDLAAAVRSAQGDTRSAGPVPEGLPSGDGAEIGTGAVTPDVVVRPVLRHRARSAWRLVDAGLAQAPAEGDGLVGLGLVAGLGPREVLARSACAWAGAHRLAVRLIRSPGRRAYGLRRLVGALVLDLIAGCVALFLVGMIVSPWIGL